MNMLNMFNNATTMERFTAILSALATPPLLQRFPYSSVLSGIQLIELTSFYSPLKHIDKKLFEEAYVKFQRQVLSIPQVTAPPTRKS
jgi:hypothetical protein